MTAIEKIHTSTSIFSERRIIQAMRKLFAQFRIGCQHLFGDVFNYIVAPEKPYKAGKYSSEIGV